MSHSTQPTASVVMILPYINTYRVPLLRLLASRLEEHGIHLRILHGTQRGNERGRNDVVHSADFVALRQVEFRIGRARLVFRRATKDASTCDLLILEQATRNIESYLLLLWRAFRRRPTAMWGHGYTITETRSARKRAVQRWMMNRSSWFFAYTAGSAARGLEIGATIKRTTILNNTIDYRELTIPENAPPEHTSTVGSSDVWQAAYIGALDRSKRIEFLLETALQVAAVRPSFRLVVAGSGELESLVKGKRYSDVVRYVGHIDAKQKRELAIRSRVLLVPGRVGLVAVDSFALGLPIVTIQWPFHAPEFEYLENQRNAIIAERDEDYLGAIVGIMDDDSLLSSLREGCRDALAGLSIDSMVDRFTAGILAALEKKKDTA